MIQRPNNTQALLLRPASKDKRVLSQAPELYQGYHASASLPDFMTPIVRESGKPYIVDPQTYLFIIRPKQLRDRKTGALRSSVSSMAQKYGQPFRDAVGVRKLTPGDFSNDITSSQCVGRVLEYQRIKFSGQLALPLDPYYAKYHLWDDQDPQRESPNAAPPQVLVPPYFYFKSPDDPWFDVNLAMGKHALAARGSNELVFPILLFHPKILSDTEATKKIASRYLSLAFDGYLIWPNAFVEEREQPTNLKGLARLVETLAQSGRRVSKLYGGFLSALLAGRGLGSFSCGIGTGAFKNAFAYGGGGQVPKKFYIPRLHCSLEFGEADQILRANPSLRCSCEICSSLYGRKIDDFPVMQERGHCELHFLHVRNEEIGKLASGGSRDVAKDLRKTAAEFQRSMLVNAGFLEVWAQATC